ncbi:MAG: hypothetical protein ACFFD6_08185, partial [Candidatus Thorarchaeota archaeon]
PLLKDGLYSAENIDKELDAATKLYLSSKEGLSLDKEKGTLSVSKIFKWYKKDFEISNGSILKFIHKYAPQNIQTFLDDKKDSVKLTYIDYDWGLNLSEQEEN